MKLDDKNQKIYWESLKKRRTPEHPVIEAFVEPKINFIKSAIPESFNNLSILDVGCGNGFFTYYFTMFSETIGLDFSELMLSMNPCQKKVCGSAFQLPFKDNSFDIVFCSNLLHHIDNQAVPLEQMKRVSRKYVIVSEPNRNNPFMFLFGLLKKEERGTIKMSMTYLKRLLLKANLKIHAYSTQGAVLPNKCPKFCLTIFKKIERPNPLAFYHMLIALKKELKTSHLKMNEK